MLGVLGNVVVFRLVFLCLVVRPRSHCYVGWFFRICCVRGLPQHIVSFRCVLWVLFALWPLDDLYIAFVDGA